jgi:hypothetical protein
MPTIICNAGDARRIEVEVEAGSNVWRAPFETACGIDGPKRRHRYYLICDWPLLAQSGRSPNLISGAILSCDSAARLVAICALPTDPGWLEHDLLQAITIGDDDHKVEFAILLHQASG